MSPKPNVSGERTEQIIEAALKVFAERGVERARMEDVGAAAGLSKATLYLYFRTKDALIGVILHRLFDHMLADLLKIPESEEPVRERLRGFINRFVEEFNRMEPLMPLLYECYAIGLRKASTREIFGEFVGGFISTFTPIIEQGIARGELRAVDAEKTAVAIGAVLEGTLLLWAFAPDRVNFQEQITYDMELLLAGL